MKKHIAATIFGLIIPVGLFLAFCMPVKNTVEYVFITVLIIAVVPIIVAILITILGIILDWAAMIIAMFLSMAGLWISTLGIATWISYDLTTQGLSKIIVPIYCGILTLIGTILLILILVVGVKTNKEL